MYLARQLRDNELPRLPFLAWLAVIVIMRPILAERTLTIPDGVTVEVKSRRVTVTGPRGKLWKDLSHICCDIYLIEDDGDKKVKVDCHFRKRKELSALRTVVSHISNMITGVTIGYRCDDLCFTAFA